MIEIKNLSGKVICTVNSNSLVGANLEGAYLRRANLRGANLRGANLRGANLTNTKGVLTFNGERHLLIYYKYKKQHYFQIGCVNETRENLLKNFEKIGKSNGYTKSEIELYGTIIKTFSKYDIV